MNSTFLATKSVSQSTDGGTESLVIICACNNDTFIGIAVGAFGCDFLAFLPQVIDGGFEVTACFHQGILQSIMPAPVICLSLLTSAAVIWVWY